MNTEEQVSFELPQTLVLIISVFLTVLISLFLSFSDKLQTRLPSPSQPTAVLEIGIIASPIQPTTSATPTPLTNLAPTAEPSNTPTPNSVIAQPVCNNVPPNWVPVVVGPGDMIYDISIQYGATISEIIQANCLEGSALRPGMTIYVPPTPPTRPPCGPPQWWTTYVVRPGETLGLLAVRHGTTVYAIMQANCLSDTRIFAGRHLFLPPITPTAPPPPTIVFPTRTPNPSPTSSPTTLPSPTPTPTTESSATPTSTGPAPTGTIVPTNTPTVTGTPPASGTPTSTGTPPISPTVTLSPTTGPSPTDEPSPTAVPTSTPTLPPTNTPVPTQPPTNTPQPSATTPPQPSNTPEF